MSRNNFQLYRHFDVNGNLLYVGISFSAVYRAAQHRALSHWWKEIANIKIENFDNENSLIEAERKAIREEKPKYNKHHAAKIYNDLSAVEEIKSDFGKLGGIILSHFSKKLLYDVTQASEILSMTPTSLRKLAETGEINYIENGKRKFFYIWDIISFCEMKSL